MQAALFQPPPLPIPPMPRTMLGMRRIAPDVNGRPGAFGEWASAWIAGGESAEAEHDYDPELIVTKRERYWEQVSYRWFVQSEGEK